MPEVDEHSLGPTDPPIVVVLSGPSGVGKDAVLDGLREHGYPVAVPATMTTRDPRPGEVDGVHHVFVTHEQFKTHIAEEVSSGEITQAIADKKLANVTTKVTEMVNNLPPARGERGSTTHTARGERGSKTHNKNYGESTETQKTGA